MIIIFNIFALQVSLKVHPDRATPEDRDAATQKFQALGATYKILSDPDSKGLYDESGEIDDENDPILGDPNRDWTEYWRMMFAKVTVDDIKQVRTFCFVIQFFSTVEPSFYLKNILSFVFIPLVVKCITTLRQDKQSTIKSTRNSLALIFSLLRTSNYDFLKYLIFHKLKYHLIQCNYKFS